MRNKIIILPLIFIFSLISCSTEEVSSDSDTKEKEYNHHVSSFSVSGEKLSIFDPASEIDSTQGKKSPKINYLLESQNLYVNYPDERPTIFLFVAHWCPYCQNEIPVVKNWIQNEQLFEQGINIVLVVTNINPDKSNYPPDLWLNRAEWEYPVIYDDNFSTLGKYFGVPAFPYWVFTEPDGTIAFRIAGSLSEEQLINIIDLN